MCDLCKTFLERALGVRSRGGPSPSAAWPRRDGAGWHRAPRGRLCSVLCVQDAGQGRRAAGSCGCWWRRTCPHHARGSTPEPEMEVTGESEPPSRCGQSSLEVLWGEGGVAGPVVALLRVQTTGPRGGFDLAPPRAHEPQGRREAEAGKGKASWSSRSHSRRGARGEWKPRKPLALRLTPQLRSSSPQSLRDLSGTNLPKDRHLSEQGSLGSRPRAGACRSRHRRSHPALAQPRPAQTPR